jgi:hypothetical protein
VVEPTAGVMLGRPNFSLPRVFPTPTAMAGRADDIRQWLSISQTPFRIRHRGDPTLRLRGILWLQREALLAEYAGDWNRADFYWEELEIGLQKLVRAKALANAVRDATKTLPIAWETAGRDPGGVLVDELLVDACVALHNTLAGSTDGGARALQHFERLKRIFKHSAMTSGERATLVRPIVRALARAAEEKKEWSTVAAQYRALLAVDPEDTEAQQGLIRGLWLGAKAQLGSSNDTASARREAKLLLVPLRELEGLLERTPFVEEIYDALSDLHLCRAVRLTNAEDSAAGLESIERAVTAYPGNGEAQQIKKKLSEMMSTLQERMHQVLDDIRRRPNATLNAQGYQLQRQTKVGFDLAKRFAESEQAKRWTTNGRKARAMGVWTALGLAPVAENWDARALLLVETLSTILAEKPATPDALQARWEAARATDPELAGLPTESILRFLAFRLFDQAWEPQRPGLPALWVPPDVLTVPVGCRTPVKGPGISLSTWLRSGQEPRLKWQLGAAMVAALFAITLLINVHYARERRDAAMSSLAQAIQQGDHASALQAAGDFLTAQRFGVDPRTESVKSAYRNALVQWVHDDVREFGPEQRAVVDRYRRLGLPADEPAAAGQKE